MKLYYTDPLIAAYMAREFGVKSRVHSYLDKDWDPEKPLEKYKWSDDPEEIIESWITDYHDKRAIHADSYDLFKPNKGDLVNWQVDGYAWVDDKNTPPIESRWHGKPAYIDPPPVKVASSEGGYCKYPIYRTGVTEGKVEIKIIQRDGKHFFMPEKE